MTDQPPPMLKLPERGTWDAPVAVTRKKVLLSWALAGTVMAVTLAGVVLIALWVNRVQDEGIKKNRDEIERIRRLEQPPTDAEIAAAARRALEVCAENPECRNQFLVVVKRVRVDVRPRVIRITRTRTVRVTIVRPVRSNPRRPSAVRPVAPVQRPTPAPPPVIPPPVIAPPTPQPKPVAPKPAAPTPGGGGGAGGNPGGPPDPPGPIGNPGGPACPAPNPHC